MTIRFDQLVSALSGAVVDAQYQLQKTHIGGLYRYFEKDGSPISVALQIPRVSPETGKQESIKVSVPLITLVKPSQMSIQEMQITMQVDMSEINKTVEMIEKQNDSMEKTNILYSWKAPEYQIPLATSTTTGKKPGEVGLAQVTLRVTTEETPEGLARLLDHLNKSL